MDFEREEDVLLVVLRMGNNRLVRRVYSESRKVARGRRS